MDFSETIEACDLKVVRCRQLVELIKVWKVKVIFWPWPQGIYMWKLKLVFLRNYLAIFNQILYVSFQVQGNENQWIDAGHMTKMAARPIYGKNPSKIFFSWTGGPISTKPGM